ncbi:MAG: imidazoleglycerol-phosphate dehydratase HisB [Methanohalobium sp.]|uniref:imidazoleglycerol-phosphate dehydratase HisB n=1 Tax=Methanohalobium sp. TaxID=2837493 RepID=UPI00397B9295
MRSAKISRETRETSIEIELNIDGRGEADIDTGIGFFDHMLASFAKHSGFDLNISANGDFEVDEHHLIEDTGIVLGQVIDKALDDKSGIARYGDAHIPMDESLADVALDLGGRSYLVLYADFETQRVGNFSTQMVRHFFESLTQSANMTLHASIYGYNDHHKIEALFKAFAHSMKRAVVVEGEDVRSTKGMI